MIFSGCSLPEYEDIPVYFPLYDESTGQVTDCYSRLLRFKKDGAGFYSKAREVAKEECSVDVVAIKIEDYESIILPHNNEVIDKWNASKKKIKKEKRKRR